MQSNPVYSFEIYIRYHRPSTDSWVVINTHMVSPGVKPTEEYIRQSAQHILQLDAKVCPDGPWVAVEVVPRPDYWEE